MDDGPKLQQSSSAQQTSCMAACECERTGALSDYYHALFQSSGLLFFFLISKDGNVYARNVNIN
jgi:hypothetical protein